MHTPFDSIGMNAAQQRKMTEKVTSFYAADEGFLFSFFLAAFKRHGYPKRTDFNGSRMKREAPQCVFCMHISMFRDGASCSSIDY
jgi:hypothetical protein